MTNDQKIDAKLRELGHDPKNVLRGTVIKGDPGYVRVRLDDGPEETFFAQVFTVRHGDRIAVI